MTNEKNILDQVLGEFDISEFDIAQEKKSAITIWVSDDYKKKFDLLQEQTGKKFVKCLREIIKKSIDKVS